MNKVSITINGTRYELMPEENEVDVCNRCALQHYCNKIWGTSLCAVFGNEHLEVFKAVKDNVKDTKNVPKEESNRTINVQIEYTDGTSRYYRIGSLDDIIANGWVTLTNIDGVKETINTKNIKTIREAQYI